MSFKFITCQSATFKFILRFRFFFFFNHWQYHFCDCLANLVLFQVELLEEEDTDLNLLLPVDSKERRVVLRDAGVQVDRQRDR